VGDALVDLAADAHAVYRLAPDLLVVFKPRDHHEPEHAHPYGQRLRVLRGRLAVDVGTLRHVVVPDSPVLRLPAHVPHATRALDDTWLVAERAPE